MYLANGDFQFVNASNELEENITVCESGGYSYKLTQEDITREQSAFEPAPDVSIHFLHGGMNCPVGLNVKSFLFT